VAHARDDRDSIAALHDRHYESLIGSIRTVSAPLSLTLEQATVAPGAAFPGADAANVDRAIVPLDPGQVMDTRIGSNGPLRYAGGSRWRLTC
jgi:hypothetical protein